MRALKNALIGFIAGLLAVGCATREQKYSITYRPDQSSTNVSENVTSGYTNRQAASSNTNGHLYTEAPRSPLTPTSANSVSRIYSEPISQPQAGTELKDTFLNEDNPWNPHDKASTESDRAIIRQIRRSVRADYVLSMDADNLNISAKNGQVTLAGAVKNEQEKKRLDAVAEKTAGVSGVQDQLAVKPE